MSLRELDIKVNYESGVNDLINDFYVPTLIKATQYDRIAGYFSSTALAIAARGISGLVQNNGKMRLIISPQLSEQDIETINQAYQNPEKILASNMINELSNIEDVLTKNYVYALGWLIANGLLEIKVAIPCSDKGKLYCDKAVGGEGIFHQKVGVIRDVNNNVISFSGSINETASGWLHNIEEFKVFKSWVSGQYEYCKSDINKFEDFWANSRKGVRIIPMPQAVNNYLIERAPRDVSEVINLEQYAKQKEIKDAYNELNLFNYQQEAVNMWLQNNKKLILEMATGTGKTRTAIGCIAKVFSENEPTIIFVVCPQNTLSLQWKRDIEYMGIEHDKDVIADSTNKKWRQELEGAVLDVAIGMYKRLIIYTTHKTSSSKDFIKCIGENKYNTKYMFVGDEAHGLGSKGNSKALIEEYDYRLGLSATPKRWYDDQGTQVIYDFFGDKIFEFSIKQALHTINPVTNKPYLTSYQYYPLFTTLVDEELEKYDELSTKIRKVSNRKDDNTKDILENLLFKRAQIHKSAINKYSILIEILERMTNIEDIIIFVSYEQINEVCNILQKNNILFHRFTEKEGTSIQVRFSGQSERQFIIQKFKEKKYQVLVAIKCLDEGIDIPSAKTAILLASNTNPREYVQRIGRVIRQHEDKSIATIYDIIIAPRYNKLNKDLAFIEKKIFEKEMVRSLEIAENAINNAEATKKIFDVLGGE